MFNSKIKKEIYGRRGLLERIADQEEKIADLHLEMWRLNNKKSEEIFKLKAIVAELCDYVYSKDKASK